MLVCVELTYSSNNTGCEKLFFLFFFCSAFKCSVVKSTPKSYFKILCLKILIGKLVIGRVLEYSREVSDMKCTSVSKVKVN